MLNRPSATSFARVLCAVLSLGICSIQASAEEEERDLTLLQAFRDSAAATTSNPDGLDPVADSLCYTPLPDSLTSPEFRKLFKIYVSEGILYGYAEGAYPTWTPA
jgi:hypothetical protein